ncbi:DMT family transporter [Sediminispirochaeta bajacaliforniensis]|uniref:DMT family transporter n=1 Tax=Sediminispirochaeta bajacaliforniensis TaxID=148 RepID=UPI00036A1ABE|nr:DMT family transporter [Sediminispirochaeta bajacaliforniensis]
MNKKQIKTRKENIYLWSIALIACTIAWGGIHPATKSLLINRVNPFLVAFLRFLVALLTTLPFFIADSGKRPRPSLKDTLILSGIGIFGVGFFSLLLSFGLELTNATSSSILINSQPIYAAILSVIFLKERFTLRHLFGIILGSIGILFVATRGTFSSIGIGNDYIMGNILCILGSLCISVYYVALKNYIRTFGSIIPTFISTASGTVVLLVVAIAGKSDFHEVMRLGCTNWMLILFVGVIATGFANIVFNQSLHAIGVIRATGFKFMVPVFGVILSVFLLGERANIWVYTGIAIVLAAIYFLQTGNLKRSR